MPWRSMMVLMCGTWRSFHWPKRATPAPPAFCYGPRPRDENQLWMARLAYYGRWSDRGKWSVGAEKANYRKTFLLPGESSTERSDQPWRIYRVVAIQLSKAASAYAGYTQEIEQSLDLGARYQLKLIWARASLRLLAQNVGNVYSWGR
jgi:hypothetical protein